VALYIQKFKTNIMKNLAKNTYFSKLTIFFKNLKISEPNAIFNNGEGENMIEEWLAFGMIFWG